MTASWPIECGPCRLRRFQVGDEPSVARHANDRGIWENLRDLFPHPYLLEHAEAWVGIAGEPELPTALAIEVDGSVCGGVGFQIGEDISRRSAEIGYWLGREYWGKGIVSAAVGGILPYGFATFDLERIWAGVIATNAPSLRVLEKNGFEREGTARRAIFKDGKMHDQVNFGLTREDWDSAS